MKEDALAMTLAVAVGASLATKVVGVNVSGNVILLGLENVLQCSLLFIRRYSGLLLHSHPCRGYLTPRQPWPHQTS